MSKRGYKLRILYLRLKCFLLAGPVFLIPSETLSDLLEPVSLEVFLGRVSCGFSEGAWYQLDLIGLEE